MKISQLIRSISSLIEGHEPEKKIVIMPDFFLDHIVSYEGDFQYFISKVREVAERGGGNVPFITQYLLRGGNAANTASALSSLGIKPYLILRTSPLGFALLNHFLGERVDLSHVKVDGRIALTVALELQHKGRKVNVMLSDAGSVYDFGFEKLDERDIELIRRADVVCVFNWNHNKKGTELVSNVFSLAKGIRYLDTGDPSFRVEDIEGLMRGVLMKGIVDVLSLNENEAIYYASYFRKDIAEKRGHIPSTQLALESAEILEEKLERTRIDLHTSDFSASLFQGKKIIVPAFNVSVRRLTGAGDAWNAGNIYAELVGLKHDERLLLANAVAGFYISDEEARHPTKAELLRFLKEAKLKSV